MTALKVGDAVRVDLGRRAGIQDGTVTALLPGGRFTWKNRNNYERTSRVQQITSKPLKAGKLDPYMRAWSDEDDDED